MNGREMAALSGQESIVVIRRPFVAWLGNIGRALLFDQVLFESGERGGEWFAESDAGWQNRLLLSRRETRDARDHLVGLGILETKSEGMPRRMWYKLDADKAAVLFTARIEAGGASTLEWPNGRARLAKRPSKGAQMATHSIQGGEGSLEGTDLAPPGTVPPTAAPQPTLDANTSEASNGQPNGHGQTPPPSSATPPPPAWAPFYAGVSETLGGLRVVNAKTGAPLAWVGEIARIAGAHVNGEGAAGAARLWREFTESRDWQYAGSKPAGFPLAFGKWVAGRRSNGHVSAVSTFGADPDDPSGLKAYMARQLAIGA